MTKAKEYCKATKNGNKDQIVNSPATKKGFQLPRQMIRVQRSEPSDGIIRNELRFVSYSTKDDNGSGPIELRVVSETFNALVSRLREQNIIMPEIEQNVGRYENTATEEVIVLRRQLAEALEECNRLRQNIEEMQTVTTSETSITSSRMSEPEWVQETEARIKAVADAIQPLQMQAQRFAPQISQLKTHLLQILDEIHERRLKGQLHDDKIRNRINAKIQHCRQIASETIGKKYSNN